MRDEFEKRRNVVYDALRQVPGVERNKPEAFYMMCKLPVEDATISDRMLEEFDVDGETVAAPGEGFMPRKFGKDEIRLAFTLVSVCWKRPFPFWQKDLRNTIRCAVWCKTPL